LAAGSPPAASFFAASQSRPGSLFAKSSSLTSKLCTGTALEPGSGHCIALSSRLAPDGCGITQRAADSNMYWRARQYIE
jgi:hypothetical protein